MHLDFDAKTEVKTGRNTLEKGCQNGDFQRVAREAQRVAGNFIAQHIGGRNTLRNTSIFQRVALIPVSTQWDGGRRNTATLLSLKYFYNRILGKIDEYVRVYKKNTKTTFEVLRGAPVASARRCNLGRFLVLA